METPKTEKAKKSFKILIIAGVLILIVAGGVAGLVFFASSSSEDSTVLGRIKNFGMSEKKSPGGLSVEGYIYKMDPFLVNLADPGQFRYLKITLQVESSEEKVKEEYEKKLAQLRDAVLTILSSKNYKDIMNGEGKRALREEIKGKLNQILASFKVQNIYFTEFVVQ